MERDPTVLANIVLAKCEEMPDRKILTFVNERENAVETRTFAEILNNANCMALFMRHSGMKKGDRFAALLQNHAAMVEALIAASIGGFVIVPIDPRTSGEKLEFMITDSGCSGIFCADYNGVNAAEVAREAELEWVIAVNGLPPALAVLSTPVHAYTDILNLYSGSSVDVDCQSGSETHQILYTSGTTGDPKGIIKTNSQFYQVGTVLPGLLGLTEDDCLYSGLSLTHGNAQFFNLAVSLAAGIPGVFSQKFTKSRMWETIRRFGCTYFTLLGGMSSAVYSEPIRADDADNPVRMVLSAGMPEAIWKEFEARFNLRLVEVYGTAEGGLFWNDGSGPAGSFGNLNTNPLFKARVVGEGDRDCAPGESGELIWRDRADGSAVVEYHGNPDASEKKTKGGWFRSGDIVHSNQDGWLFFDRRDGGGIRRNGDFINPGFVEKVIAGSPQVSDVFVYGTPIVGGAPGEKDVVAAIVLNKGSDFDAGELTARCRADLETNFVPSYFHVLEEIPKTASEKPQERFLLEMFSPGAPGIYTVS